MVPPSPKATVSTCWSGLLLPCSLHSQTTWFTPSSPFKAAWGQKQVQFLGVLGLWGPTNALQPWHHPRAYSEEAPP